MNVNTLRQNYQGVKVLLKIIQAFQSLEAKSGNCLIKYEQYYIDRVISTVEDIIKHQYNSKDSYNAEIIAVMKVLQGKTGYETLKKHGFKPWDKEVTQLREDTLKVAFDTIGEFVYPVVDDMGKLANIQLQTLIANDKEYLRNAVKGFDEKLVNEDIWLSLYAIYYLIGEKKITECQYLIVNLLAFIAMQEAMFMVNHQSQCKNSELINEVIAILKNGAFSIDNILAIFHKALIWVRLYNNAQTFAKYPWIEKQFSQNEVSFPKEIKEASTEEGKSSWDQIGKIAI